MKKSLILFAFLLTAGFLSAQSTSTAKKSCSKTCAKKCTKKDSKTTSADVEASETYVAAAISEADIAAEADENIERKVCEISGNVGYYEKKTCDVSGKVSYNEVFYDGEQKQFVNVDPKTVQASEGTAVKAANMESDVKSDVKTKSKSCAKTCSKTKKAKQD